MKRIGRYFLRDITIERINIALRTRLKEFPHTLAWNFDSFAMDNKERIQQYKNKHLGKRCFILANGPSLSKMNLSILKDEYTFGLNRVYLLFQSLDFRPTYYLAVNELILEQFSEDIAKLKMPKFTNWNRRSFFPQEDTTIHYLKSKMVFRDAFIRDMTKPIVVGGTVTYVAMQLAFYMGFRKVILIGLDHHYQDKGVPSRTVVRNSTPDQSHFHTNYFPGGSKWQLPDLYRSEIDYELARRYYEKEGREILDATIGGKCQIFTKVKYESLF